MPSSKKQLVVYIISDMSGELAFDTVRRTLEQHPNVAWSEKRFALVNDPHRLAYIFKEAAAEKDAASPDHLVAVAYTFAEEAMRKAALGAAIHHTVPTIGLMVESHSFFSSVLGQKPMQKPGHKIGVRDLREWDARQKALEFMHEHDDGQNVQDIALADVVIVGISRVSKSPHCMYLAYKHLQKAANVVITKETEVPRELDTLPKEKVFLLTIDKRRLASIREARLANMGAHENHYADLRYISAETEKAERVAREKGWEVINVTDKGIEETASKIMNKLSKLSQQ